MSQRYAVRQTDPPRGMSKRGDGRRPFQLTVLCSPVCDVDVRLVGVAAFLTQRDLSRSPLALPRDLRVVLLELVEEDGVAGALELLLELVVRLLHVAVEVALDHVRRALCRLFRVRELVLLDVRE